MGGSVIQVPLDLKDEIEVRRFLGKIVEVLDTVVGIRRQEADLNSVEALEEYARQVDQVELSGANNYTDERTTSATSNPKQGGISNISYTAPVYSAPPTQVEMQQLANDVEAIANKVNSVLGSLRAANIISI